MVHKSKVANNTKYTQKITARSMTVAHGKIEVQNRQIFFNNDP